MKLDHKICGGLFENFPLAVKQHIIIIEAELRRAKEKHPSWPKDPIHRAAIVNEESGELIRSAIQYVYEGGSFSSMQTEAIQTAATAIRFLIDPCPSWQKKS